MKKEEILLELARANSKSEKVDVMVEILTKAKASKDGIFIKNAMEISKDIFK